MCDSVVAVGVETAGGTTLFGKNSDRKPGECQTFLQFSEAWHPPDAKVRCTHVEIPQVSETYQVMGHSPWWVWGFEHGVNEHAVAIGNHTIFSNEAIEEKPGLIGMDLVRLGLERGRSAREALEVIAGLIELHGQGGPALAPGATGYHNSFTIADSSEAWLLETSNRHWAARRATLEGVSNHFGIGTDWEFGSRGLEVFAKDQGWGSGDSSRLDVAAAFRNPHIPPHISEGRQRRSNELLRAERGRHDVGTFRRLLRDHGDASTAWDPRGATTDHERYFTICAHSEPVHATTASLVAALPKERETPWPVWIGFGTPCTGILLPVYLAGVIPPVLARGAENPAEDSMFWAFERLQAAAGRFAARGGEARLRLRWLEVEQEIEVQVREFAGRARAALRSGNDAAPLVTAFMARCAERVIERIDELCAELS